MLIERILMLQQLIVTLRSSHGYLTNAIESLKFQGSCSSVWIRRYNPTIALMLNLGLLSNPSSSLAFECRPRYNSFQQVVRWAPLFMADIWPYGYLYDWHHMTHIRKPNPHSLYPHPGR